MCLGTSGRLARSLATTYSFARVRIIGTKKDRNKVLFLILHSGLCQTDLYLLSLCLFIFFSFFLFI